MYKLNNNELFFTREEKKEKKHTKHFKHVKDRIFATSVRIIRQIQYILNLKQSFT